MSGGPGRLIALAAGLAMALAVLGAAAIVRAAPASAHATVDFTDPADGARLAQAPQRVLVAFSEPVIVSSGYLQVLDASGARVDVGDPAHPPGQGEQLEVRLRPGLGTGGYLLRWRVVSVDSHVVSGAARFAVGDAPLPPLEPGGAGDAPGPAGGTAGATDGAV